MKKLLLLFFLFPAIIATAQQSAKSAAKTASTNPAASKITLACKLWNVPPSIDSINLYELSGLANRLVARAGRRLPDSAFVFTMPVSKPRIYGVGATDNNIAKVILGEEKEVTLWGNSNYMEKSRAVNSAANKDLENMRKQIELFGAQSELLRNQFFNTPGASERKPLEERAAQLAKAKNRFLDSLKNANALLWRMATLSVTPEFIAEKNAAPTELEFYGKHYFRYADLKDKSYEETPEVFNGFENYIKQLVQLNAPQEKLEQYIEMQLGKLPTDTKTYRLALGGIISGLKTAESHLAPSYTNKYLDLYRKANWGEIGRLEFDMKKSSTFTPGFEAPDLAGMTPDSGSYSLKQMRGKVVLIDFWASWCGPCRKENPNVVANYNKYKDKGFDILGVSLDKDRTAWLKAIEKDGLPWRHISDLKGWQSSHAALYSVTSIPQTLLLDRNGKIIARNVRGEQLGEKLKEIFGE